MDNCFVFRRFWFYLYSLQALLCSMSLCIRAAATKHNTYHMYSMDSFLCDPL